MTVPKLRKTALATARTKKHEVRTQFGALAWRERKGRLQVCLVTTRGTGRWVVPKGWPMRGRTPAEAAAREAYEEAGLIGLASEGCIGLYSYMKGFGRAGDLPCVVALFPLRVTKALKRWPEMTARERRWLSPAKAASQVREPELKAALLGFDPG